LAQILDMDDVGRGRVVDFKVVGQTMH
jgi:hypothetical protein